MVEQWRAWGECDVMLHKSPQIVAGGEQWARFASDHPDPSTWRYLLVGETDLFNAKGNWDLLLAQAEART
jgi:hypothetical protein